MSVGTIVGLAMVIVAALALLPSWRGSRGSDEAHRLGTRRLVVVACTLGALGSGLLFVQDGLSGSFFYVVLRVAIAVGFIWSVRQNQRRNNAASSVFGTGDSLLDEDDEVASNSKAADWYPDPAERFSSRWWDGEAWTDRVRNRTEELTDPMGSDWS